MSSSAQKSSDSKPSHPKRGEASTTKAARDELILCPYIGRQEKA